MTSAAGLSQRGGRLGPGRLAHTRAVPASCSATGLLLLALEALAPRLPFAAFATQALDRSRSEAHRPPFVRSCRCHAQPLGSKLFPCPLALPLTSRRRWSNLVLLHSNWMAARRLSCGCWCWLTRPPTSAQSALQERCEATVASFLQLEPRDTILTGTRASLHAQLRELQAAPYSGISSGTSPLSVSVASASLPTEGVRVPLVPGTVHPVLLRRTRDF